MESIAVVTGGAGAIGRAIAAKLAESHSYVVLVDINEEEGKKVVASIGESRCSIIPCNVTDSASIAEMARRVQSIGKVQTLVNNAGGAKVHTLHDTTPENFRQEVVFNLDSAYMCFNVFQDNLKQTRGSVVNISSGNGIDFAGDPAYSAAKAGLIHLSRSIAVEYGKFGIRANTIAPGTVRTAAWDIRVKQNPNVMEELKQWYPLGRTVKAEEIANAVAFLTSDLASAITGVCLPVDCGFTAGHPPLARAFTLSDHY